MYDELHANQKKIENANQENQEIIDRNTAGIVLKVIGVGGAGNNAIQMMNKEQFKNVEFIVANTDAQALASNDCKIKIALGKDNRGLGAGSDPEVGAKAAKESLSEIQEKIGGADVVIIAAGLGGGTGTGAAPIIAEAAKNNGALTIAIITTPFDYEGPKRRRYANEGIQKLAEVVDSYIILSNSKLSRSYGDVPISDSLKLSNISLKNIILAIHDVLYRIGTINIDYADVKKMLTNGGLSMVGIATAVGKDRAEKAVEKAFEQKLYEKPITKASRMIINVQTDSKATLNEIDRAVDRVYKLFQASRDSEEGGIDTIIGYEQVELKDNGELFKVSIIVTGSNDRNAKEIIQPIIHDNDAISFAEAQYNEFKQQKNSATIRSDEQMVFNSYSAALHRKEAQAQEPIQADMSGDSKNDPTHTVVTKQTEIVHEVEYRPLDQQTQTQEYNFNNYFEEPSDELPEELEKLENVFGEQRTTNQENSQTSSHYSYSERTSEYSSNGETREVNDFLSYPQAGDQEKKYQGEKSSKNLKNNSDDWY
ncbi:MULTISPECIES: cell division protein FtsZ [unclassified Mycoplasma]|uniref:cell division protein FtsZ n=1 Tax=unclassified Mycoplasma TaxID=2683645 RepID=UPI00211C6F0F|nr:MULTISPECIES: cell division protein FtsZ [unclassified Mycoplasma]UUM20122.1 cell division FtsZ family protein [Mycoplasma sp. 1578d]UUM25102.1 cell division FtsZ family protein [Mycoplasma sp. 3686d]